VINDFMKAVRDAAGKFTETWTPTMNVVMLGARGSGKSSLIATMYDQLQPTALETGLRLECDRMSEVKLRDIHGRLSECARGVEALRDAVSGTRGIQRYHFTLVEPRAGGKSVPALHFDFVDYPGGWVEELDGDEGVRKDHQVVVEAVGGAGVLVVAVDAPYLMEDSLHRNRNRPELIECLLRESFAWDVRQQDAGAPRRSRLVLFVPIRGEKWARSADGRIRMTEAMKTGYAGALKFLASGDHASRVTVVTTPVMTTGCVEFDSWREGRDGAEPRFVIAPPGRFEPVFCDQPVNYMFRFAIEEYRRQRTASFSQAMRYIFDDDGIVQKSATIFAAKCLQQDGFQVLQG